MPHPVALQAGAITIRVRAGAHEVLVVRAKKNPTDWIFPKGHIEPGESAAEAAVRELLEEAGVHGRADHAVGDSEYPLGEKRIRVTFYLVWYQSEGEAQEQRERAWLPLAEARERLTFIHMRQCLDRVIAQLPPAR